ncbi:hypothetical protein [Spectribacter hydrogenoxidans]|uniref:Tetratricopeptide repeat-containing protein n=1 Tax=Spectribacter hydrogenoxidans TaxID=3075608 RepID=A0ABU3C453_9GAMM|nr:hypothetical protein [Salinisphaera sp. W335]MDT0636343.1 hypothetical protein [Salinisphaera sp. W335]
MGALLLCLVATVLPRPVPAAANGDAFPIQDELATVKSRLLALLGPATDTTAYAYLNIEPDLSLRSAQLQVLSAEDTVVARIDFNPSDRKQGLLRADLPAVAREERSCRFVLETSGEATTERRVLACRLPGLVSAPMLEIRFRERWLGPELRIRAWQPRAEADAESYSFPNPNIKGLVRRLMPSASSPSLAASDGARAVAPDVRYSVVICVDTPWAGLHRLYDYKERSADPMSAAFWRAYADCALRAGVPGETVVALRELEDRSATLAAYETRLQLASHYSRWDDSDRALRWLAAEPAEVPLVLRSRWRDLLSRLYLSQGRIKEAVTVLSTGQHLQAAGTWMESFDAALLHYAMRMNYAYALMNVGRRDEALAVLDRVGRSPTLDAETGALRAQANTALGWQFLSQGYGASAGRVFHRVSLSRPAARKALLGMGWAMVAPRGEAQPLVEPPGFVSTPSDPPTTALKSLRRINAIGCAQYRAVTYDAVQDCVPSEEFERVAYDEADQGQLRRTLRFWDALIENGGIRDAAALEAHIAAANTYNKLGDRRRGQILYRRAVTMSEEVLASLERLEGTLQDGNQWLALAAGAYGVIGEAQPTVFDWLARAHTQTLLDAVATTQQLSQQILAALGTPLRRTAQGVDLSVLRGRTEVVRRQTIRRLKESITAVIEKERDRFERYRLQAAFQLAEMQQHIQGALGSR